MNHLYKGQQYTSQLPLTMDQNSCQNRTTCSKSNIYHRLNCLEKNCSTKVPFPPLLASIIPARIRYSFITTSSLRRKEFVWSRIHDQRFQQNGGLMWKEVRLHFLHLLFTSTICCCFLLCLPLTNSLFFLELLLLLLPGPLPPPPPAPLLLLLLFGSVAIVVAVVVVTVVIMISTEETTD